MTRARLTYCWCLALSLAACSSTETESEPAAPAEQAESGASAKVTPEKSEADNKGRYTTSSETEELADPEAALAAIPERMRPVELLPDLKKKLLVPDLDKQGIAMFSDIVTIEPGQDVTFCTYVSGVTDKTLYIHDTLGSQTHHGHHAILQYTTSPTEPGTRLCDPESLEAQQGQVLGGTGGEGNGAIRVPANVVSEVPAGSQFIINHHWINTSDKPVQAQAEMITIPPDSEDDLIIARAFVATTVGFKIPAKQTGEASVTCTMKRDVKLLSMIGHQHSWGVHVKAERLGAEGEVLFDHDYDEAMISHPKTRDFSLEAPLEIKAGDSLKMSCQWNNTTDQMLTFPREMCVFFGWQIGASADTQCLDGNWVD